ncbi:MAG: DUF4956 domain-containing protein [Bacteroidetes bacterium HGW-Bacteroidetes-6]|nr:MAG: DUF4956 domain-containing protein [Bacteroidetes bacterium HGW-Bacteroidetes-6]
MDWINVSDFLELSIRFGFNLIVSLIITRGLYYSNTKRKDYFFSYLMIGIIVFLLCFLLNSVKLQLGFALGLFAIFGILRYRTNPMPIREMTYLFIVIGISVINALSNKKISYAELLFTNFGIVAVVWLFEKVFFLRHLAEKEIVYEKIELIKPEKRAELIADIEERTGIKVQKIEIGKIDFLRDSARLIIYYYLSDVNAADNATNSFSNDDE